MLHAASTLTLGVIGPRLAGFLAATVVDFLARADFAGAASVVDGVALWASFASACLCPPILGGPAAKASRASDSVSYARNLAPGKPST